MAYLCSSRRMTFINNPRSWILPLVFAAYLATASQLPSAENSRDEALHAGLLRATVRLRVTQGNETHVGSGTVVATSGSQSLIATCAHVFKHSQGAGAVQVTLFSGESQSYAVGELLIFDNEFDVALVRANELGNVAPIPFALMDDSVREGDRILVAGCDGGGLPMTWNTQVTVVDRFFGRPTLGTAEIPRDGRSGGAAINESGRLIGICNASNPLHREGVYAGVAALHRQLAEVGDWKTAKPVGVSTAGARHFAEQMANRTDIVVPVIDKSPSEIREAASATVSAVAAPANSTPAAQRTERDVEIVCILRPNDGSAATPKIVVIPRASAALLQLLASEEPQHP